MKTIAVVPALNEETNIGEVVRTLKERADLVLVVDDGSADRTAEIARNAGAHVVSHLMNRGYGAATATGIQAAVAFGAGVIVTFDADGQHRASDIPRLVTPVSEGAADIAIGCRTVEREKIPWHRRLAHWCANVLTALLFGMYVKDSQSGLRAISRRMAESMDLKCDKWEVSSEIVREIKRGNWRLAQIPIVPIYTEYSLSKGQGFVVGLKTAARLMLRRMIK